MTFVKVTKTKAYFKRFQVKYRRRHEGKTDYFARQKLIVQAKNKYSSPKYRLVVRFTNKYVICQVVYSEISGDKVLASAYSKELSRYGLSVGLKNYAAAYCTGLLVARRTLKKLGLDSTYEGNTEIDGEVVKTTEGKDTFYVDEVDEEKRPFKAILDVGIAPTTTGARLFGAMKGAADGGFDIPHNEKRFPGYDRETKEYDASVHKEHIMGGHVMEWMEALQEEDAENGTEEFQKLFADYIKAGVGPEDLEELYEKVHAAIRADPSPKFSENAKTRNAKVTSHPGSKANNVKLTYDERKARVAEKLALRDA
jgi:large subunit ribosomal protein L5e